jgi:hypothetical protein
MTVEHDGEERHDQREEDRAIRISDDRVGQGGAEHDGVHGYRKPAPGHERDRAGGQQEVSQGIQWLAVGLSLGRAVSAGELGQADPERDGKVHLPVAPCAWPLVRGLLHVFRRNHSANVDHSWDRGIGRLAHPSPSPLPPGSYPKSLPSDDATSTLLQDHGRRGRDNKRE